MHPIDEQRLVESCLQNNRIAQRRLYEQYAPAMKAVCYRYIGENDTAEDILQDAFIKVFMSLEDFTGKGSLEGWIRRIVVNSALEYLRRNDVLRNTIECDEILEFSSHEVDAIEKISAEELMDVIASLPSGFRTVFNMYAIEGYSHKEIAQILGINEGSSRSQYNRARMLIQKKIKQLKLY